MYNKFKLDNESEYSIRTYYGVELETRQSPYFYYNPHIARNNGYVTTYDRHAIKDLVVPDSYYDKQYLNGLSLLDHASITTDFNNKYPGIVSVGDDCGNTELRFSPMSLKYLQTNKHCIDYMLKKCIRNGFIVIPECGIHIHLDRKNVNLVNFVTNLRELYKNDYLFFHQMADRLHNDRFSSQMMIQSPNTISLSIDNEIKNGIVSGIKINTLGTYEIRWFGTTLNVKTFIANVEYIDSLLEYCLGNKTEDMSMNSYMEYIGHNTVKYKHLVGKINYYGFYEYMDTIITTAKNVNKKLSNSIKLIKSI